MPYLPGTHLIATLKPGDNDLIIKYEVFREHIDVLIQNHKLQKLGEVYHNFEPGGFTAVICLSESHISVHTWPEHNLVNLDIYLSNYQRNNDGTVISIFETLRTYFGASIIDQQTIIR